MDSQESSYTGVVGWDFPALVKIVGIQIGNAGIIPHYTAMSCEKVEGYTCTKKSYPGKQIRLVDDLSLELLSS